MHRGERAHADPSGRRLGCDPCIIAVSGQPEKDVDARRGAFDVQSWKLAGDRTDQGVATAPVDVARPHDVTVVFATRQELGEGELIDRG